MSIKIAAILASIALTGTLFGGYLGYEERLDRAAARLDAQIASDRAEIQAVFNAKVQVEAALREERRDVTLASYRKSAWPEWNAAVAAGIEFANGRDGQTPKVVIYRSATNMCDMPAAGCAQYMGNGTCRLFIDKSLSGNRWALLAVGAHEVLHCVGHPHDDGDLVMAP